METNRLKATYLETIQTRYVVKTLKQKKEETPNIIFFFYLKIKIVDILHLNAVVPVSYQKVAILSTPTASKLLSLL